MSSRRGHISKGTFLTSSSYDAVAKDRSHSNGSAGAMSVSGQKVASLGADAQHYSAGTTAGNPLSLIRNTRNFAGWIRLRSGLRRER